MNGEVILAFSLALGILTGLAVLLLLPSSVPYSMANDGFNGYSSLYSNLQAEPVIDPRGLEGLDSASSGLLVSGSTPVEGEHARLLHSYTHNGGLLIASGTPEFLNSIFKALGLEGRALNATVYDMVYNEGDRSLVIAFTACGLNATLPAPSPIEGYTKPLAYTSNYSYADLNGNGYLDPGEPIKSFTVAGEYRVGSGVLIVVSSPYAFTNNAIGYNAGLLHCLLEGRRLYVDQVEASSNPFEALKLRVEYQSRGEVKLYTGLLAGALGVAGYAMARRL